MRRARVDAVTDRHGWRTGRSTATMPDKDGYEIASGSVYARPRPSVLHHPCDTYVPNRAAAKREHNRSCRRGQAARAAAEQAARERERATINAQLAIGDETP